MSHNSSDSLPTAEEEKMLRRTLRRMNDAEPDVDAAWRDVSARTSPFRSFAWSKILPWIASAAAIIALIVLFWPSRSSTFDSKQQETVTTSEIAQSNHTTDNHLTSTAVKSRKDQAELRKIIETEVSTGRKQIKHTVLPDGSQVWLNANSAIHYRQTTQSRTLRLTGEAYFEIHHDADRPFIVTTDYFTTTDLGTTFNINVYSPHEANITLIEGSVRVDISTENIILRPGQQLSMERGEIKVESIDTYPLTQWKEGWFYFQEETLGEIMQQIARWYGVNVVFESPSLMSRRLHFVASRNESLNDIAAKLSQFDGQVVTASQHDVIIRSTETK